MDELLQEMITPAPSRTESARRRRLGSTVLILALAAVGVTGLTTSALFSDNETFARRDIVSGSVDLSTDATELSFASDNMAPGDSAFAEVTVTNSGSLAYRYAVRYLAVDTDVIPGSETFTPDTGEAVPTAHLSAQLRLRVYADAVTCGVAGTDAATAIASVGHVDGAGALETDDWAVLVGDVERGSQGGDRPLSSTAGETLCFRLDLPTSTGNEYQATASSVQLRFDAEQVSNNP